MIKSISIRNFQSHRSSVLKFTKGVNVIVGESDSGKTAILRALKWVMYNKPNGDSFRRHNTDNTSVSLFIDKQTIAREKGKNNVYALDDKEFKAFGTKVPTEISDVINMNDINFQSQFDSHFLLNKSGGQVASFFNELANFEKIDSSLIAINSNIRKIKSEVSVKQDLKKGMKQTLKDFAYLKDAEKDLKALQVLDDEKNTLLTKYNRLLKILDALENIETDIEVKSKLIPLLDDIDMIESNITAKANIKKRKNKLQLIFNEFVYNEKQQQKHDKKAKLENSVVTLLQLYSSKAILHTKFELLDNLYTNILLTDKSILKAIKTSKQLSKQFHKEMGSQCILCEQTIKN